MYKFYIYINGDVYDGDMYKRRRLPVQPDAMPMTRCPRHPYSSIHTIPCIMCAASIQYFYYAYASPHPRHPGSQPPAKHPPVSPHTPAPSLICMLYHDAVHKHAMHGQQSRRSTRHWPSPRRHCDPHSHPGPGSTQEGWRGWGTPSQRVSDAQAGPVSRPSPVKLRSRPSLPTHTLARL